MKSIPREVHPDRRAYVSGHRPGKNQGLKSDYQRSNPTCFYNVLCFSFLICIIGITSQRSYGKVNEYTGSS